MKNFLHLNRKGSAMVEAAIIYPLVIGTVMAVIYIIINMYILAAQKAFLNMELRAEAMRVSGTGEVVSGDSTIFTGDRYSKKIFGEKAEISRIKNSGHDRLYGSISRLCMGNTILEPVKREQEADVWAINEKEYMRKVDLVLRE